jgi:hypothetical protein
VLKTDKNVIKCLKPLISLSFIRKIQGYSLLLHREK